MTRVVDDKTRLVEDIGRVREDLADETVEVVQSGLAHGLDASRLDPGQRAQLQEALSDIQLVSKLWLLDELTMVEPPPGYTMLVLGGWCGVLPWLARHATGRSSSSLALCVDLDAGACSAGHQAFGTAVENLHFLCQDLYRLDYERLASRRPLVVVNTVCEHLHDLPRWRAMLPPGVLTVLQSNDYRGCPDHVNCVDSVTELGDAARLEVVYAGSKDLSLFTRFMIIGRT